MRTPFDAFEIHPVAPLDVLNPEHPDPNAVEPITSWDDVPQGRGSVFFTVYGHITSWDDVPPASRRSVFFTVYGHRGFPDHESPDLRWLDGSLVFRQGIPVSDADAKTYDEWHAEATDATQGLGLTAISDHTTWDDAVDLAFALADGKPVHEFVGPPPEMDE